MEKKRWNETTCTLAALLFLTKLVLLYILALAFLAWQTGWKVALWQSYFIILWQEIIWCLSDWLIESHWLDLTINGIGISPRMCISDSLFEILPKHYSLLICILSILNVFLNKMNNSGNTELSDLLCSMYRFHWSLTNFTQHRRTVGIHFLRNLLLVIKAV